MSALNRRDFIASTVATATEGETMIAAADKSNLVVQVGMQRRSMSLYRQAMENS